MACLASTVGELERDGWLVNQTRMWLSSDWAVRHGQPWRAGEDLFFTHLLDGSRAANRLGWQWTTGVGSSKHYGFSRWQVEKRAPELCRGCALRTACPIEDWPDDPEFVAVERPSAIAVPDQAASARIGPTDTISTADPDVVWLTAESLGVADPALRAWGDRPVVFTFDRATPGRAPALGEAAGVPRRDPGRVGAASRPRSVARRPRRCARRSFGRGDPCAGAGFRRLGGAGEHRRAPSVAVARVAVVGQRGELLLLAAIGRTRSLTP